MRIAFNPNRQDDLAALAVDDRKTAVARKHRQLIRMQMPRMARTEMPVHAGFGLGHRSSRVVFRQLNRPRSERQSTSRRIRVIEL